ncbi:MAG: hypothetical protein AAGH78_02215 [Cyanobacteria bacterium P01_H01_bin.58]
MDHSLQALGILQRDILWANASVFALGVFDRYALGLWCPIVPF